jgi:cytochrome c oxidase cbb3-type subunit III
MMRIMTPALVLLLAVAWLGGQEPTVEGPHSGPGSQSISDAAIAGAKQDPAAVARGGKDFATYCAGCHGQDASGGPGAPDLVRSLLVLDDEKGILIGPVIREGRPAQGMPKLGLSESQIADLVAWLHARTYAAGHRGTYTFGNIVTGNAEAGKAYFNGAGTCNHCHSPTGDLAGIASRYDAFSLQGRWLNPRSSPRGGRGHAAGTKSRLPPTTVTVKLASGKTVSGDLEDIDDFYVSLRDSSGALQTFKREDGSPKIETHDPLEAHGDLLHRYSDADIHNITAYLETLK